MNKEVIKAMNRKEKKKNQTFQKWWDKNDYKVKRAILFPVWITILICEKVTKWLDNRQK